MSLSLDELITTTEEIVDLLSEVTQNAGKVTIFKTMSGMNVTVRRGLMSGSATRESISLTNLHSALKEAVGKTRPSDE